MIEDNSKEDEVGLYNTVDLYFEDDDEVETYRLVTTVRGNTLNGSVSIDSVFNLFLHLFNIAFC